MCYGIVPDNAVVKLLKRPSDVWLALLVGAVVGAGAGSLLGPVWAVAGVVSGPFIALAVESAVEVFTTPDPAELLQAGRHREALAMIGESMPSWRAMARIWPGQFQDALAHVLIDKSMALLAAHREDEALAAAEQGMEIYRALAAPRRGKRMADLAFALNNLCYPLTAVGRRDEALGAAEEAVQVYRALARDRPKKYEYRLANSLGTQAEMLHHAGRSADAVAVTSEATRIYDGMRAGDRDAQNAAEVLFLHGRLLCILGRPGEAARPLARAWRMASQPERQPWFDQAVLDTAYRADPAAFRQTWRAQTGTDPPLSLTAHDGSPN
jgi:tetratricopeptide (TPR) repeat protein